MVIDNDQKAEEVLNEIREIKEETQRLVDTCEKMISKYKDSIDEYKAKEQEKLSYLESCLYAYFETVKTHKTKTMEKYTLPSGVIKKKYEKVDFQKDDEKLLKWLLDTESVYIKTELKPNWLEFKKELEFTDSGDIVTKDGEVVEGVTKKVTPDTFVVEV